jgi:hypothetical protein
MIDVTTNRAPDSSPPASSWTLRVGYAACAWGLWFAAVHFWLFFGPGSFRVQVQFAHSTWVYAFASILSVLMFTAAALLPLALVWPFRWTSQRRVQQVTVILSYAALIGFIVYELVVAQELGVALSGATVCIVGGAVALTRPRHETIAHRMVLTATWAVGIGMTLYGGAYIYFAFLQPTFERGLGYFLLGGVNFTLEGILFVATAWMSSRGVPARIWPPARDVADEAAHSVVPATVAPRRNRTGDDHGEAQHRARGERRAPGGRSHLAPN